jgi:hypothetical protein
MDSNDGAPWDDQTINDLKAAVDHGRPLEEIAQYLCRSGTIEDVARKCRELGLKPKRSAR